MMCVFSTWRIIPVSKRLITMVGKSPKWGYSPYKWPKWFINRGDPNIGMILQVLNPGKSFQNGPVNNSQPGKIRGMSSKVKRRQKQQQIQDHLET